MDDIPFPPSHSGVSGQGVEYHLSIAGTRAIIFVALCSWSRIWTQDLGSAPPLLLKPYVALVILTVLCDALPTLQYCMVLNLNGIMARQTVRVDSGRCFVLL
jgi:hypothetical protein